MTKYYFISYVQTENTIFKGTGYALAKTDGTKSLAELVKLIQDESNNGRTFLPICLQPLSEEDFEILSGNRLKGDDNDTTSIH